MSGDGQEETPMEQEATYICECCGEEVTTYVDPGGGAFQEYVEDCPVCCRPNVLQATLTPDGRARVVSRPE